jgi:hypothetical protein
MGAIEIPVWTQVLNCTIESFAVVYRSSPDPYESGSWFMRPLRGYR